MNKRMDKRVIEDLKMAPSEELEAAAEFYDALIAASKPAAPFLQGFDGRRIPLDLPAAPATPDVRSGFAVVPDYSTQGSKFMREIKITAAVTVDAEKLLVALEKRVARRCADIVYGGHSQEAHRLAREIEREFALFDAVGTKEPSAPLTPLAPPAPSASLTSSGYFPAHLIFWELPSSARRQLMTELGVFSEDLLKLPEADRYSGSASQL